MEKEFENSTEFEIVREFKSHIDEGKMSLAAIGIACLLKIIEYSKALTIHGLRSELIEGEKKLVELSKERKMYGKYTSNISLVSGCQLFIRSVTRQSYKELDFGSFKKRFVERGKRIHKVCVDSKSTIGRNFAPFMKKGKQNVLLVGFSSVALHVLVMHKKERFHVYVPEGRPDGLGYISANVLAENGIPVTIVCDSAIARLLDTEKFGFVLSGAEGVLENGGIINKIGCYQIALIAKALNVPFYVTVESFKFVRKYFLQQKDLKKNKTKFVPLKQLEKAVVVDNPISDYTPPEFITFLVTDLGILTTSAISDELIKLYS